MASDETTRQESDTQSPAAAADAAGSATSVESHPAGGEPEGAAGTNGHTEPGAGTHAAAESQEAAGTPSAAPPSPDLVDAMAHGAGAGLETPAAPAGEEEKGSEAGEGDEPRRRPRLNPTVSDEQAKARPSITPTDASAGLHGAQAGALSDDVSETGGAEQGEELQADGPPKSAQSAPVALPPKNQQLDAEIEAEIAAAMSSGELDAAVVEAPTAAEPAAGQPSAEQQPSEEDLSKGAKLRGKVQSIHGDDVFLDLGYRSPGVVSMRQFEAGKKPQVGQLIEVVFDRLNTDEGLIYANLPKGIRKISANWDALAVGQIVDCVVMKTNKGGLEITCSSLRGFLPASQVDLHFVSDLEPYVGQKLRVQVTEVNPKKRNLVVSRRAYLQQERQEAEETLWKTLEIGQVFTGQVKTIKDYGAFVDIGGVDGFLHVGEISWSRIHKPADLLSEGQQVEVKVIGLDPEKKKISLGMRQLTQNPWANVSDKYPAGAIVSGKVTRTTDFGAFVELESGIEGLVHISELEYRRVRRVDDVLRVGQETQAKVLEVDPEKKRISLSVKALKEAPADAKPSDADLAPGGSEPYVSKRKGPLKGGMGSQEAPGGLFGNPKDFGR